MAQQRTKLVQEYLDQLSPLENTVYRIANAHLQSSFSLEQSLGFIEWKKKKQQLEQQLEQAKQLEQQQSKVVADIDEDVVMK
jgi:hypothetical protein